MGCVVDVRGLAGEGGENGNWPVGWDGMADEDPEVDIVCRLKASASDEIAVGMDAAVATAAVATAAVGYTWPDGDRDGAARDWVDGLDGEGW